MAGLTKIEIPVDTKLKIKRRYTARGYKPKVALLFGKIFSAPKFAVLAGTLLVATLAAPALNRQLVLHAAPAPVGKADVGKAFWQAQMCQYCHGGQAEGAWGPDLAGRGLSEAQIKHALRQPYGLMPAYTETQVSDQTVADLQAFFFTLPKAEQFGPWRWQSPPAGAPEGQRLQSAFGCGQCHEPELAIPRRWLGGVGKDADFAYFSKQIYQHTEKYPQGRMGNFSKDRLPEMVLRVIYQFMLDAGFRAPINASLKASTRQGTNTTYILDVFNDGVTQRGLDAENVTIFLKIPPGTKFVSATGAGFKGVRPLAQLGLDPSIANTPGRFDPSPTPKLPERPKPDFSGDVAVWEVPRIAAAEKQIYTLTLSGPTAEIYTIPGPGPTGQVFRGFEGSTVYWAKPGMRMGPPQLVYRDLRLPDKGDQVAVTAVP
jgi:mono/diheme cytochrome c family protein